MKFNWVIITTTALALAVSACASKSYAESGDYNYDPGTVVSKVNTPLGELFANADGKTLYTFTKDGKAKSNCYDACANSWPPFMATKDATGWGKFSIITRKDGTYQWAYADQPLYTWVGDQRQGDTYGQGMGNAWYVVKTGN